MAAEGPCLTVTVIAPQAVRQRIVVAGSVVVGAILGRRRAVNPADQLAVVAVVG